jgi:hypothetical protein
MVLLSILQAQANFGQVTGVLLLRSVNVARPSTRLRQDRALVQSGGAAYFFSRPAKGVTFYIRNSKFFDDICHNSTGARVILETLLLAIAGRLSECAYVADSLRKTIPGIRHL